MLDEVALAYGGFDSVVVTAGVFVAADPTGHIPDEKWATTFAVNVTGGYVVADEAAKTFRDQGLPGTVVLTTSANAVVPKKGSVAYDCSKAAAPTWSISWPSSWPRSSGERVARRRSCREARCSPRPGDQQPGQYGLPYAADEPTDVLVLSWPRSAPPH